MSQRRRKRPRWLNMLGYSLPPLPGLVLQLGQMCRHFHLSWLGCQPIGLLGAWFHRSGSNLANLGLDPCSLLPLVSLAPMIRTIRKFTCSLALFAALMICSCHKDHQPAKIVAAAPPSSPVPTPTPTPTPRPMPTPNPPASNNAPTPVTGSPVTTASGLQYWDLVTGTGDTAVPGKMVRVHYTGWLTDGTKFDSSVDRQTPFQFPLGAHRVIKGWDEGVAGMQVGGKRQLRIPPELGYGERGAGGRIPPGATLIFDVELLEVK
jgi:hypothetical protein